MPTKKTDPRVAHIDYKCSGCGKPTRRADLTVKRVEFATMGEGYKTLKRRTVGWFCKPCRDADPDWNLPAMKGSPGLANTKMNEAAGG